MILEQISAQCGYLIALTKNSEDLNIAGGAVVAVVQEMLGTRRASAFSAGNPSAFREAYNATVAFLQGLESLCPTLGVVQSFRKHSSVMALIRKFNISVYFTLRFQARGLGAIARTAAPHRSLSLSLSLSLSA